MERFEELLAEQQAARAARDAAWGYSARQRRSRREATAGRWRMGKVIAAGLAIAIPAIAMLTGIPATGAADELDGAEYSAVVEVPEEAENERIELALLSRAHKLENCKVTYYDAHCVKCCGKTDGITASGVEAAPYVTCAVDPAIIPFGADVIVDYGGGDLRYYKADDAGVTGNHIDICVSSHAEALQLGVTRATVYWVDDAAW